jgi:hypothetical protein
MATKTISIEIDAYDKLRSAKRGERESFSSVVRRARWDDLQPAAGEILAGLQADVHAHPEILLPAKELKRLACRTRTIRRKTRWEER